MMTRVHFMLSALVVAVGCSAQSDEGMAGSPPDAIDDAVQANVVAAGYRR